ncbi:MAG: 3',5'-nucleoside bisphosphate phosphatase [Burkholderiales bacterium]
MNADLHSHSTASDGALAPGDVVRRAAAQGVEMLALTDHDQLDGLQEARQAARETGTVLIDGVEISVTWRGVTLHVVGLGVDLGNPALNAGLERVRSGRVERAQEMGRSLERSGISGSFEGALALAANAAMVSRTHFARYLVQCGHVAGTREAFRHYLVPGKPGYVRHNWAQLADALRWIGDAGGHAVLAHPGRYALSASAMESLLAEFRAAGGRAIEVVTGSHSPDQYALFGALAIRHGLAASRGSDFHGPDEGVELGSLPALDPRLRPVWEGWEV